MDDHLLLEFWAQHIKFVFNDDVMLQDLRRQWGDRGSAGSKEFVTTALAARFAMRAEFVVSDESSTRRPLRL